MLFLIYGRVLLDFFHDFLQKEGIAKIIMAMIQDVDTVITDFHSVRLLQTVSQEQSCRLLIKGMVKAIAVKTGKTSGKDIEKIHKKVQSKFNFYALSGDTVKQRYMAIWPEHYKYEEELSLVEDGCFVKYDTAFPMYEELAKRHTNPDGVGLSERMDFYRIIAEKHIRHLYADKHAEQPDHIIHVTSTGYVEPNPVDVIMSENKWYDVPVTNFYNRACNASISAIRTANALMRSSFLGGYEKPKKRVDLVHSELFSIHIKISDDHPVNIGLMSSYSDSFLRYSIRRYADVRENGMGSLKIIAFRHMIIPESTHIAVWKVSSPVFDYKIDPLKYLKLIRSNVRDFVHCFFREIGIEFTKIKNKLLFAIQAPSLLVLKQIGKELELSEEQLAFSKNVLYENGYLSSGAIPFMCKHIIESSQISSGQQVLCIGHALGLTISGMLLEKT